ncbi:MAG: bifunctional riboflavin kinase/FAD synthetase [Cyanobacteria bacterium J06623_5]
MWITSSLKAAKTPTNIALGNFDGVHLGHQRVMAQVVRSDADNGTEKAAEAALTPELIGTLHTGIESAGIETAGIEAAAGSWPIDTDRQPTAEANAKATVPHKTVVTFSPHPQEYFSGISKPLLTPVEEKTWQLARLGIHQLVMLPFNQALAALTPEAFVQQILIDGLQAKHISVGSDFRFGAGRSGTADQLSAIAATYGVPVTRVSLKHEQGDRISSSRIRAALQAGEPNTAARLLGRPYTLTGRVVKGKQLGRTIGFPTANLQIPSNKYLPRTGVYSVWAYGIIAAPLRGIMNIGHRPTVNGQTLSIEVHLLDWAGDLYGQLLTVSLEGFVRAEQKFDSLEQLKQQIAEDCQQAIDTLTTR